jgi:hypothetical protein
MLSTGRKCIAGVLVSICMASAHAETVDVRNAAAIEAVVRAQIEALEDGNANLAFALTTPAVRRELGSPENLLRLIEEEYDPLYRHLRAIYLAAESDEGEVTQTVRITDQNNHVWLVIYEMERQPDGSWRIDGWELLETDTLSV